MKCNTCRMVGLHADNRDMLSNSMLISAEALQLLMHSDTPFVLYLTTCWAHSSPADFISTQPIRYSRMRP